MMVEDDRICRLNDREPGGDGRYVLYWMQQSQRAAHNPALEYAIKQADAHGVPLITAFGLDAGYPDANHRHFAFMLEGLAETATSLASRRVKLVVRRGSPPDVALELAGDAVEVVCDRGYLRHQRAWRAALADGADARVTQIEGDVVVPIETVSDKREWAARTIRRKINERVDAYIKTVRPSQPRKSSLPLKVTGDVNLDDWKTVLKGMDIDHDVGRVARFRPGTTAAQQRLTRFLRSGLPGYAEARNDPSSPQASMLSPYLHFGQISPVEIADKVQRSSSASDEDKEAFLEELIVRRELACNFVYFSDDYDSFGTLPDWARKTLAEHANDERPVRYTRTELEKAATDDEYWNAAMREMLATGYMHNYMRMYWGKKIIEWCNTPEYAYRTALYLNNKYFLDGRDVNSYTNVAWLFGLHDRAWTERDIFGKVRYMNARGLESKFDIEKYVDWASELTPAYEEH